MSSNINLILRSLRAFQIEQNLDIQRSLKHLKKIIYYYSKHKPKKDIKFINILVKTDIDNLMHKVNQKRIEISDNPIYDNISLPLSPNVNKELLKKFTENKIFNIKSLEKLEIISQKIRQNLDDNLNQTITRPLIDKRYSSRSLTNSLEQHFKDIIQTINPNLTDKIITYWNYHSSFWIEKDLEELSSNDNYYISFPYSAYMSSYLVSSFGHELGHLLIKEKRIKSNKKNEYFFDLKNRIKDILEQTFEDFKKDNKIFKNFDNTQQKYINNMIHCDGIAEEITADLIAFCIYGRSFFYTLFHLSFGFDYFAKEYSENREIQYLRICIVSDIINNSEQNENEIDLAIDALLKSIKPMNNNEGSIDNGKYNQSLFMKGLMLQFKLAIVSNHNTIDISGLFDNLKDASEKASGFIELWDERFELLKGFKNQVPHSSLIRKVIHKDILPKNEFVTYILKYIKSRNYIEECNDFIGIYDHIKYHEVPSILDLNEDILKQYNNLDADKNIEYNTKHALFVLKEYPENHIIDYISNGFIIHIELENPNLLDKEMIDRIFKKITSKNYNFEKIRMFKSLGPKDLVIIVENTTLEYMYEIKDIFMHMNIGDIIHRTNSGFFINSNTLSKITKLNDNYIFQSSIRLKNLQRTSFYDRCKESDIIDMINNFYYTHGSTDVKIEWKACSVNNIFKIIKKLKEEDYISDISTTIDQRIDLINN